MRKHASSDFLTNIRCEECKRWLRGTLSCLVILFVTFLTLLFYMTSFWQINLTSHMKHELKASLMGLLGALASLYLISSLYLVRFVLLASTLYGRRSVQHWRALLYASIPLTLAVMVLSLKIPHTISENPSIHSKYLYLTLPLATGSNLGFLVVKIIASVALARTRFQDSPLVRTFMPFLPRKSNLNGARRV